MKNALRKLRYHFLVATMFGMCLASNTVVQAAAPKGSGGGGDGDGANFSGLQNLLNMIEQIGKYAGLIAIAGALIALAAGLFKKDTSMLEVSVWIGGGGLILIGLSAIVGLIQGGA